MYKRLSSKGTSRKRRLAAWHKVAKNLGVCFCRWYLQCVESYLPLHLLCSSDPMICTGIEDHLTYKRIILLLFIHFGDLYSTRTNNNCNNNLTDNNNQRINDSQ